MISLLPDALLFVVNLAPPLLAGSGSVGRVCLVIVARVCVAAALRGLGECLQRRGERERETGTFTFLIS